jgi:putative ABC transport system ATP-binding protein
MALFETRDVCRYFKAGTRAEVRALQDVSLAIPEGSLCLLRGPSGSGKTTLLALLGALDRPTRGQVLFQERDLSKFSGTELARVRRRMGFVFQQFSLLAGLPLWENITYPLIPRGVPHRRRYEIAHGLLEQLGLLDRRLARPAELSGGEQQRGAVARALAGEPDVLLADEPVASLDPEAGAAVIDLLRQVHAQGKTVVLSSHDPELVALATQVYELKAGRLWSSGS